MCSRSLVGQRRPIALLAGGRGVGPGEHRHRRQKRRRVVRLGKRRGHWHWGAMPTGERQLARDLAGHEVEVGSARRTLGGGGGLRQRRLVGRVLHVLHADRALRSLLRRRAGPLGELRAQTAGSTRAVVGPGAGEGTARRPGRVRPVDTPRLLHSPQHSDPVALMHGALLLLDRMGLLAVAVLARLVPAPTRLLGRRRTVQSLDSELIIIFRCLDQTDDRRLHAACRAVHFNLDCLPAVARRLAAQLVFSCIALLGLACFGSTGLPTIRHASNRRCLLRMTLSGCSLVTILL
mmetsp:Transcript_13820/g.28489  ORF Transcript_13820/g.28489 Transcript_13820/m.28489 type:complete len:292 (-) Transcript_13820:2078-2953(-)